MGDIADAMLDGTLCETCGILMEDMTEEGAEPPGYPRQCADCAEETSDGY